MCEGSSYTLEYLGWDGVTVVFVDTMVEAVKQAGGGRVSVIVGSRMKSCI